jgi:hypothetical protein
MLGDKASKATSALVTSSMTKSFAGGYVELLAFLIFLAGATLLAQLLRSDDEIGSWLSSLMTGSGVICVAVTIATSFAAGAAAVYDGHHGASLATVTAVNDIRNIGFVLSGAVIGVFIVSVSVAVHRSGLPSRWLAYAGYVIGALSIVGVPAARTGFTNLTTMLWFVWFVALGVTALRQARRASATTEPAPSAVRS